MTNEELAIRIKAGERDLLPLLWEQNIKLVELWATRYRTLESRFAFIDRQDFIQCGYIALEDAVKAFDARKNFKLNSYFDRKFTEQIYKMAGIRKVTQEDGSRKRVFHTDTTSLDQPITDEKDSAENMHFFYDSEVDIEQDFEHEELRLVLAGVIERLREQEQTVIIAIYYMDMKRADLARKLNLPKRKLQQVEQRALKQMQNNRALRDLYFSGYYVPAVSTYKGGTFETMALSSELEGLVNGF